MKTRGTPAPLVSPAPPVVVAQSVTQLDDVAGKVLVAGSHGGIIAAYLGATAGAHALILNDAGVGKDRAGVAGLGYLEGIGMAAATVAHTSARIGDGADMLARGVISHANLHAAAQGVVTGQACREAARRLCAAPVRRAAPPPCAEGRWRLESGPPEVWALDSVGKVLAEDAGRILVIGSHGALHGGRRDSALAVDALAAVFNDAGVGADRTGISRLPVLAARGIPAATVACMSARIGDGRSTWRTGVLSHVNAVAERAGARPGDPVKRFVALFQGSAAGRRWPGKDIRRVVRKKKRKINPTAKPGRPAKGKRKSVTLRLEYRSAVVLVGKFEVRGEPPL